MTQIPPGLTVAAIGNGRCDQRMSQPAQASAGTDPRLELEYEAAVNFLRMQDTTLANVRSRATNVLSTAALLTSFSAGVGFINLDPKRGATFPLAGAVGLLLVTIAIGALVTHVHWPVDWHYGPSASKMKERRQAGDGADQIRGFVIDKMLKGIEENSATLDARMWAFRAASILLLVDVVIVLLAVIANS